MRRGTKKLGLNLEMLECRAMMAGDVQVRVVNGTLEIIGDDLSNTITIAPGSVAGAFLVTGTGTTINGSAVALPQFTGVTDDIEIEMNDGDDVVTIGALDVPENLDIDTGEGDDTVTMNAGLDIVEYLNIETGEGDDTVTATDMTVGREIEIETGDGDDGVTLTDVTVTDDPTVYHPDNGRTRIKTGKGADTVTVDNLSGTRLRLRTNSGEDTAVVEASVDRLDVRMGRNDDMFTLQAASAIASRLILRGGAGEDTLDNNELNPPAATTIRSFEIRI